MTTLDLKKSFFHVIDPHRWLAVSGYAWNLVGHSAHGDTKKKAHELLPNVDVLARDTLLMHARSLIDFYTKNCQPGSTDILVCDFGGLKVGTTIHHQLEQYKNPVEVHLLHLTDWRDPIYCSQHLTSHTGSSRQRPNWNSEASAVVDLIFDALKNISQQTGAWQTPFKELYKASTSQLQNASYVWPTNLCEWFDVEKYLISCGL